MKNFSAQTRPYSLVFLALLALTAITQNSAQAYVELSLVKTGLKEGALRVELAKDHQPWGGYWWPDLGMPLTRTTESPMQKYDRFAKNSGNFQATQWENKNHAQIEEGLGHCNGWAAASVLLPEPRRTVYDSDSKTLFFPGDLKALYSEVAYCANAVDYGSGGFISADQFHEVLTTYLGSGVPVAANVAMDRDVENRIISMAHFQVEKVTGQENQYRVSAQLKIHSYDRYISDESHVAGAVLMTFRYLLNLNEQGEIVSGEWLLDENGRERRPSFLWIPLSLKNCEKDGNPYVKLDQLKKIESLPDASLSHESYEWNFDGEIAPGSSITIPFTKIAGTQFRLQMQTQGLGDGVLRFHGFNRDLPYTKAYGMKDGFSGTTLLVPSNVSRLESITLENTTRQPLKGVLRILGIDYFKLAE